MGLLLFSVQARGQTLFHVMVKGTSVTTNDAGDLVKQPINNQTLIKEAADNLGETNLNRLRLVYVLDGHEDGDIIGVINTNATVVFTNLALLLLGPENQAFTNADQTAFVRCADVFTARSLLISSDDVGNAVINGRTFLNHGGAVRKVSITGTLQYNNPPVGTNTQSICTSSFTVGRPLP